MASGRHSSTRWSTLPLPLVQLLHASQCAKTAAERFFYARQLWETTIKLLSSACLAQWWRQSGEASATSPSLFATSLLRLESNDGEPSLNNSPLGAWWRWVKLLLPRLCQAESRFAHTIRDWLYADCPVEKQPWCSTLQQLFGANLIQSLPRTPAAWLEYFLLGATSPHQTETRNARPETLDQVAGALRQGWVFLATQGAFFRETRLVFLQSCESVSETQCQIRRYELSGLFPRYLPAWHVPSSEAQNYPAGQIYWEVPSGPKDNLPWASRQGASTRASTTLLPLHPLLFFVQETEELFLLHTLPESGPPLWLSPGTGRCLSPHDLGTSIRSLVDQLSKNPLTAEAAKKWLASLAAYAAEHGSSQVVLSQQAAGYELLSEVLASPHTVHYRAWQTSVRRPLRLSCLLPSEGRDPLLEEERACIVRLIRTRHPHLLHVYEYGCHEGITFIASEFVPGVNLSSLIDKLAIYQRHELPSFQECQQALRASLQEETRQERPLCDLHTYERRLARYLAATWFTDQHASLAEGRQSSLPYLVWVLRQGAALAYAVHYLHEQGNVHGVILPNRVLVSQEDGRWILLEPTSLHLKTTSHDLAQSLRYLSPERRGAALRITPQADIYSLAVLLTDLLLIPKETLSPGDDRALTQLAHKRHLPAELVRYLHQCLAPHPEERPASAEELAQKLEHFAEHIENLSAHSADPGVSVDTPSSSLASNGPPTIDVATPTTSPEPSLSSDSPRAHARWGLSLVIGLSCTLMLILAFGLFAWWLQLSPQQWFHLITQGAFSEWAMPEATQSHPSEEQSSATTSPSASDTAPSGPWTQLAWLQQELESTKTALAQARSRIQELEQTSAQQKEPSDALQQLRQELQLYRQSAEKNQERLQEAQARTQQLTTELHKLQILEKTLQQELATLQTQLNNLQAENQNLRSAQWRHLEWLRDFVLRAISQPRNTTLTLPISIRSPTTGLLRDLLVHQVKILASYEAPITARASALLALAWVESEMHGPEAALAVLQEAYQLLHQTPVANRNHEHSSVLYGVYALMGSCYLQSKRYSEAESAWLQALRMADELGKQGSQERWFLESALCHAQLAQVFRHSKQWEKAETAYSHAHRILEKLYQSRPEEATWTLHFARICRDWGALAEFRDQLELADQRYRQAISTLESLLQTQPLHSQAILLLAHILHDQAALRRDAGQDQEALAGFQRGLELIKSLPQSEASSVEGQLVRRDLHAGRAHLYMNLRQFAEAVRDWEEAIAYDWERLPNLRAYRALCWARLGDIARAVAEAERLYRDSQKTGSLLYNLACVHAVVAEVLGQDQKFATTEPTRLRETHASQAVELLRQAADLGYFRVTNRLDYLQRDQDLQVLRSRDDFKRLVEKLQMQ
ncbi:MAG: protein kinase [Gemmatales bacterium]|nr:protein kinase [Gemmatales bacterium]MDW7994249.1 protein kinase [Gemmatales bacterium]